MARSFLQCTDIPAGELDAVFHQASALKAERPRGHPPFIEGQTWALIFHKPSTRTRVSFEVGINELGGYPLYLEQSQTQMGRGESVADTAKVLSRYVHGIVIRTFDQTMVEELAREGSVSVINGLTDLLHPCQVYSDAFTLAERWTVEDGEWAASLKGRKVAFIGDTASNMAHSWILGGAHFGMEIALAGPEPFRPGAEIAARLKAAGLPCDYRFTTDPREAAEGADVVYTDVWVSMGDEGERADRLAAFAPFQVNDSVMAAAKPDAFFMHCLPAHVGEEVTESVYRSSRSIVLDQAENRLHMQKALIVHLQEEV
ncbi:MAG: ornithine carbamoyltransferase [Opitutales bacterium]|nr:ornithine carbamoyltransferase [Opitutales bacterium]